MNFKGRTKEDKNGKKYESPGIISIFYNLDSYSKFYRYDFVRRNKNIFNNLIKEEQSKITISENDISCLKCQERDNSIEMKKIVIFHEKKITCCYGCLKENCKLYLKERLNYYLKDGCLSRECKILKKKLF